MLRSLIYMLGRGVVTARSFCPPLEQGVRGLPKVTGLDCSSQCDICVDLCPTDAIIKAGDKEQDISIDLGSCIACGACTIKCPTGKIENNPDTRTARLTRDDLIVSDRPNTSQKATTAKGIFSRSIAIRVVSTGCSACDLEIGACGNPIFDMERYGVHVVASPRFADVLLVTGPVPKAMHEPLRRCYEAMAEPRLVVAAGTCAISGGVHKGGYTEANGADSIIPVNVYIPGCPPHPWSIINGVHEAMNLNQH